MKFDISKKVLTDIRNLSEVNIKLLEYASENPDMMNRANYKSLHLDDGLFRLQPWPTFVRSQVQEDFQEASMQIFSLIKEIPGRIFNNDAEKISRYYNIPPDQARRQLVGMSARHMDSQMARGDFLLTDDGLKCLEFNVTPSLGGWEIPMWELRYLNTPVITQFFRHCNVAPRNPNLISIFIRHAIDSAKDLYPGQNEINTVILREGYIDGKPDPTENYFKHFYKQILEQHYPGLRGELRIVEKRNLESRERCIFHQGKQFQLIVELQHGDVEDSVLDALEAGTIRLISGPVTSLLTSKLNLALLSDSENSSVFSSKEKELIDKYIPWSRKVVEGKTHYKGKEVDMAEFLRTNQERLVLKPSSGYGGAGVSLGSKTDAAEWEQLVTSAFAQKDFMVQERVEGAVGAYLAGEDNVDVFDMVWGAFCFGSRYAGAWVRVMPQSDNKGVINCHQGAAVSIIFNVEK